MQTSTTTASYRDQLHKQKVHEDCLLTKVKMFLNTVLHPVESLAAPLFSYEKTVPTMKRQLNPEERMRAANSWSYEWQWQQDWAILLTHLSKNSQVIVNPLLRLRRHNVDMTPFTTPPPCPRSQRDVLFGMQWALWRETQIVVLVLQSQVETLNIAGLKLTCYRFR
nr:hypothetical protein HmN_000389400 [Hymenolepis microstoma]